MRLCPIASCSTAGHGPEWYTYHRAHQVILWECLSQVITPEETIPEGCDLNTPGYGPRNRDPSQYVAMSMV